MCCAKYCSVFFFLRAKRNALMSVWEVGSGWTLKEVLHVLMFKVWNLESLVNFGRVFFWGNGQFFIIWHITFTPQASFTRTSNHTNLWNINQRITCELPVSYTIYSTATRQSFLTIFFLPKRVTILYFLYINVRQNFVPTILLHRITFLLIYGSMFSLMMAVYSRNM